MSRKGLLWLGICTYLVLIVFAILFYKERMAFNDAAFHLLSILDANDFAFQNHRYVAILTQSFPLIASRLDLSLASVAILYSASFEIVYFLVFLLLLLGFKNKSLALGYLLFSTLMVRHTFFWCLSEVVQGTAVYFIYLAFWFKSIGEDKVKSGIGQAFIMYGLLVLLVFCHPLMPFCVLFGSSFLFLLYRKEHISIRKSILIHSIFYICIYLLRSELLKTPNDSSSSAGLIRGLKLFPHYLDIPANRKFVHYFIYDYSFVSILAIIIGLFYLIRKDYLFLFFFCLSFVGYAFIINISEPHGPDQFYVEYRYLFLSIFVIFPFVYQLIPQIKNPAVSNLVIIIPVCLSLFLIFKTRSVYLKRTQWHENLMKRTAHLPEKKLILSPNEGMKDTLQMFWGVPYEMWLISTIETGETRSVIIEENEHQFDDATKQVGQFQTPWGQLWYAYFHSKYTRFTDTTTAYIRYNPAP